MFVNREKELRALEESYNFFLQGHSKGVLVYGFRKVGKTRLISTFLEEKNGVLVDLSAARSVKTFKRIMEEKLSKFKKIKVELGDDQIENIVKILMLPQRIADDTERKLIIALDEFHVPIEKISVKIARQKGTKKDVVMGDILWAIRSAIYESKDVFWIFISSIGWKKLQDYISKKYGGALTGVLDIMKIEPLDLKHSVKLAMHLTGEKEISEEIARVSGGIPRIIEILARRYNTTRENITKLILNSIQEGDFDEIFENMVKSLVEISRRDYDALIQALKAVADGKNTTIEVSKTLEVSVDTAYALLEELHKLGLLEKEKKGKLVTYSLQYPLLSEWLKMRIEPVKSKDEVLMRAFGITAESYIRELLTEAINKKIELWEDSKGTYFLGTTEKLDLEITRVYSKKETEKTLKKTKNADVIVEAKNGLLYIIEVKAKRKDITKEDITQLHEVINVIKKETKNVKGMIAILGSGKPTPRAISEAVKKGIIILTREAIMTIAKKLNYPHW